MEWSATLSVMCGKMGAGKSTRSRSIADSTNAVLIAEDEWLARLYPDLIISFQDYLKYSALLKPVIGDHVEQLLKLGLNVVMDFPANTVNQRKWFLDLVRNCGAQLNVLYLDVSNEQCVEQIKKRRKEQPERAAFDTEETFNYVLKYFEEPHEDEGIEIYELVS